MSSTFLLLIFILSSFASVNASSREWQAGDYYRFGLRTHILNEITNTDNGYKNTNDVNIEDEISYNVTAIDLVAGTYEVTYISSTGVPSYIISDFLMEDFVSSFISMSSMFNFMYSWDYEHNRTLLTNFDCNLPTWYLIEPDWPLLMQSMLDVLNESEVIFQLADPYEPILHNFTFGQFLSDLHSFSINEKDTLAKAKSKGIKDDTSVYEFIFDLSGIIYTPIFNATLGYDQYYPYSNYRVVTKLDYSEGGILNYYKYGFELEIQIENQIQYFTLSNELVLGGIEAFNANFAFAVVIPAILTVAIGAKIVHRRRRKR